MTALPNDAEVPLERDLFCRTCGYNLRTRLPSQRCPECDTAIGESLRFEAVWGALLHRPRGAAGALQLFAVSGVGEVLLASVGLIWPDLSGLPWFFFLYMSAWAGTTLIATAAEIWFVLSIQPRLTQGRWRAWRQLAIVLRVGRTVVSLLAMGLYAYVHYVGMHGFIMGGYRLMYAAALAANVPSVLFGMAFEAMGLVYFLKLCGALESRGLRNGTLLVVLLDMFTGVLVLLLDSVQVMYLVEDPFVTGLGWVELAAAHRWVMITGVVADGLMTLYVLVLSRRLREAGGR